MQTSIAIEEHKMCTKHFTSLVLNGKSQLPQCLTVTVSNYYFTTWKKINEQNVLPVLEHRAHHFPYRQRLFELCSDRRSIMPPMH
ncbi:hypothetical protein TNCV_1725021 [Trichonephila clavipes]|nr:hypothetical protein TNCV_1725021 [Trichonephila clavipes]